MGDTVYERLREHLDRLPAGYPVTESGVELRILKRLFTPEEAELAVNLKMKPETAEAIAERAGINAEEAAGKLEDMARKGLIFSIETPDRPPGYMASQFVVGIYEYHVNDLDLELIRDLEEYMPALLEESFSHLPQLRTIPVDRSVDAGLEVLPYERAEEIVKNQKKFLVAPCICRREHKMKGAGCEKPMDACLVFGWGADYYERNGLGRAITLEETLDILKKADEEGLVLQPSNSQDIVNICCCCGDCCQVLLNLKRQPDPAAAVASPFIAQADTELCIGCEACLDRCQMDALTVEDEHVVLDENRCIGCGLCISTCPSDALTLVRKPEDRQPVVPRNQVAAHSMRAEARARAKADLTSKLERHKQL
ncbi:4Fe-4S binding protein [Thermodesulfobacteriota bacterium]